MIPDGEAGGNLPFSPSPVHLSRIRASGKRIVTAMRPPYNPGVEKGRRSSATGPTGLFMGVDSLRPRVCELVFQLYGRPLHPEFFDILATRKIQREDYDLTVRITRTGHVITWENRDVHLTEVTAAADQPLPERWRLLSRRVRGEHCDSLACAHGISYQMSFQVETLPPEIFFHVHDEILADGGQRGLLYNFQPNHRLSLAPLGLITAEARPRCLILTTFHTFPDEHTVVKSQSLIEKKN
jgi:hypothetical protein